MVLEFSTLGKPERRGFRGVRSAASPHRDEAIGTMSARPFHEAPYGGYRGMLGDLIELSPRETFERRTDTVICKGSCGARSSQNDRPLDSKLAELSAGSRAIASGPKTTFVCGLL